MDNSFYCIELYQIFCPLSTNIKLQTFSNSILTVSLQERGQVLHSVCRKSTQETSQRKRLKNPHFSGNFKRPIKNKGFLKKKTHHTLSSISHHYNQFKNVYLQDTLTWPVCGSYPLMLPTVPQPVTSWEEEFPERIRTWQHNLPWGKWHWTTHQLIKAKKIALFKKRLDSFCVGVGQDYCIQTGSEL